jgi:hypothetical protein
MLRGYNSTFVLVDDKDIYSITDVKDLESSETGKLNLNCKLVKNLVDTNRRANYTYCVDDNNMPVFYKFAPE